MYGCLVVSCLCVCVCVLCISVFVCRCAFESICACESM